MYFAPGERNTGHETESRQNSVSDTYELCVLSRLFNPSGLILFVCEHNSTYLPPGNLKN